MAIAIAAIAGILKAEKCANAILAELTMQGMQ